MSGWWQIHVYDDHDIVVGTVWFGSDRETGSSWRFRCKLTHGRSRMCPVARRDFLSAHEALEALGAHQTLEDDRADDVRRFMQRAAER